MSQKALVFISHIAEEKEIAQALKKHLEDAFLNMIDVFAFSDPTSIQMGRKWLDEITSGLKRCVMEIILASPSSISRPWINFEAGAGWIRDIPVIPLCHSGMQPTKLPAPLSSLRAAVATDEVQLRQILPQLAGAIGCELPTINFTKFINTVEKFEAESEEMKTLADASPIAPVSGLRAHEIEVLSVVADHVLDPEDSSNVVFVREQLEKAGLRGTAISLGLSKLNRAGLVEFRSYSHGYGDDVRTVAVTEAGWDWLDRNQESLVLRGDPPPEAPPATDLFDGLPF